MSDYKTPDVYVDEVSTLPPSVAEVSTAIPAFIGYTSSDHLKLIPTRITSFLEFTSLFGKAATVKFTANVIGGSVGDITLIDDQQHKLYYALDLYFKNGGGDCYIVSLGTYGTKSVEDFANGIDALKTEDEPTLIIISEAVTLDEKDYYSLCQQALSQCNTLKDRFCIFDVLDNTDPLQKNKSIQAFRDGIGTNNLKYGAAYYPFLNTTLNYIYNESDITLRTPELSLGEFKVVSLRPVSNTYRPKAALTIGLKDSDIAFSILDESTITITAPPEKTGADIASAWKNYKDALKPKFDIQVNQDQKITADTAAAVISKAGLSLGDFKVMSLPFVTGTYRPKAAFKIGSVGSDITFSISDDTILTITAPTEKSGADIVSAWKNYSDALKSNFDIQVSEEKKAETDIAAAELQWADELLSDIYQDKTALYNLAKQALSRYKVVLPPAPAVAGVYASTDRDRGVWKAPANVSLNNVISPSAKISSGDQENLNIDVTGGKSVNAIRGFLGKGTLVWGARTLAGNDNEWRYVNVRRLFNMIEESTKKASYFAVFEPNEATTWLKVKGMIESFLYRLWQQGALAGSAPKAAYYVNIGLGKTMTQQDILEGRMIVEIGVAAVRPAEFIILKFSHKLQEA